MGSTVPVVKVRRILSPASTEQEIASRADPALQPQSPAHISARVSAWYSISFGASFVVRPSPQFQRRDRREWRLRRLEIRMAAIPTPMSADEPGSGVGAAPVMSNAFAS
jgi:hypothetical protein